MGTSSASKLSTLRGERSRWLDILSEMVTVDSGPSDTVGAATMVARLTDLWRDLGWHVDVVEAGPPAMVARRPGPGPRVVMLGHYDTVFPSGTAAMRPLSVAGGRARGAGAADMKAGLVVQAAAMSVLDDESCDLTVLVNGDEESGSVGSRGLIEQLSRNADVALVFEPGEPDGAIVTGRPGVLRFQIDTVGRPAHTGVEPEKGRNAIEGIAHLVLAVADVGRRGDLGTVTVAMISGGSRPNIVPEHASIVIDSRVPSMEAGDRLTATLETIAEIEPVRGVRAVLEHLEDRPAFAPDAESLRIVGLMQQLAVRMGIAIEARPARGSSDGNFTSGIGVPTIDGLGPPGGAFHTDDEWFEIDGIFTRAALVAELVGDLGRST